MKIKSNNYNKLMEECSSNDKDEDIILFYTYTFF